MNRINRYQWLAAGLLVMACVWRMSTSAGQYLLRPPEGGTVLLRAPRPVVAMVGRHRPNRHSRGRGCDGRHSRCAAVPVPLPSSAVHREPGSVASLARLARWSNCRPGGFVHVQDLANQQGSHVDSSQPKTADGLGRSHSRHRPRRAALPVPRSSRLGADIGALHRTPRPTCGRCRSDGRAPERARHDLQGDRGHGCSPRESFSVRDSFAS